VAMPVYSLHCDYSGEMLKGFTAKMPTSVTVSQLIASVMSPKTANTNIHTVAVQGRISSCTKIVRQARKT